MDFKLWPWFTVSTFDSETQYTCTRVNISAQEKNFYRTCSLITTHCDGFYQFFFFLNTKTTKVFTCFPHHVATNSLKNRAWEHTVPILINILCIIESKRFVQAKWITFIDFIKWNHLCHLNFPKRGRHCYLWGRVQTGSYVCPFVLFKLCTSWVHHPFES